MFANFSILITLFFGFFFSQNILAEIENINISNQVNALKKISYERSPDLKILKAKKDQSDAATYSGVGHYFPTLLFNVKKQKNYYESTSALVKSLGLTTPAYSWGIDYQWPLFNYSTVLNSRKSFKTYDQDKLNLSIGEKEYDIDFNIGFLNYVLSKYKTATIFNSIKKAETAKREAKLGFELGQKTKIDVLRADANFVSLNSKKITYADEEQNSLSKFILKTGLQKTDLAFLDQYNEEQLLAIINELSNFKKINDTFNLTNSPLNDRLNDEIKINNLEAERLTAGEWPELKIQGSYANSADQLENTLHTPSRSHTVALVLTIPLFSGGSLITSNFEQYFQKKQIAYSAEQKKLELENSLNNSSIKVHALETLVESLSLNVNQFEELFKLTSKSYTLGKSTLFELLEVQDKLLEAKINLASSKIQLYQLAETFNWQTGI